MFDKIYRQANDDIPLNIELLASLKEQAKQIDTSPVSNVKNKYVFNVYRYGFVAAALIVVALSTNIFSSYLSTKNDVEKTENYIEKSTATTQTDVTSGDTLNQGTAGLFTDPVNPQPGAEDAYLPEENLDSTTENTPPENTDASETASAAIDSTQEVHIADEPAPASGYASDYATDADRHPIDQSSKLHIAAEEETDSVKSRYAGAENTEAGYGGGSGGSSAAAVNEPSASLKSVPSSISPISDSEADISAASYEEWSIEKYCSYFGFDISGITLPDGMTQSPGSSACVYTDADGNITDSQCSVFYSANGKSVAMTLCADVSYVKAIAEGETKISENAVLKSYENGAFTIYVYLTNCGYIVEASGLSYSEAVSLALSLK